MCDFCDGKKIEFTHIGQGLRTLATNLSLFFGASGDEDVPDYICLVDGQFLEANTSSGEYASQKVKIQYCPFCGRELKEEKQDED